MNINEELIDKLVYLDPGYISFKYEEIKNVSPTTQFSKTEGGKTEGSIYFLKADVNIQETRTFKLSSIQMLKEIYDDLRLLREFRAQDFQNYQGTQTAWIDGSLTMGEWKPEGTSEASGYKLFELRTDGTGHALLVQPENFSANIGALLTATPALRANIGIPVRTLARVLYLVEDIPSFVTAPYLILEK